MRGTGVADERAMHPWLPLVSSLLVGAASAPHCFAMCGPLAAFASRTEHGFERARFLRHQLGRLVAYALLGAIAAGSGAWIARALAPDWVALVLGFGLAAGMIAMAVELTLPRGRPLAKAVRLGTAPRTPLVVRVLGRLPREPMLVGAISALLPCGALYAALLVASSAGSAWVGALSMAVFALVSGIGLVGAGLVARSMRSVSARRALGVVLVLGAVFVVARPLVRSLSRDTTPACGSHQAD